MYSRAVDKKLRALQKRGRVHSVKIRWFDGRAKGSGRNTLHTDVFRFYYVRRRGLAQRLRDDIAKHLEGSENSN